MEHPSTRPLRVALDGGASSVSALLRLPDDAWAGYVFGHGAGAGMAHPFMASFADGLAERGVATLRYQFPYMEQNSKRPDTPAVAHAAVRAAVAEAGRQLPGLPLLAGGKSYGGRMTSQAQASSPLPGVRGLVFVGFPLHPAGKPDDERAAHLFEVRCPMLFLQGTRDELATLDRLRPVVQRLGDRATLALFDDADHSFHVRARSGRTDAQTLGSMLDAVVGWARASAAMLLAAALWSSPVTAVAAERQTVCTITVNSPDEQATFRRHLPASRYRFVELVERGRPDWLTSSCRKAVACDVLIVSAHFDGGNNFFSDQLEASEYLTVDELERVSCNESCPTLFSRLKEVYLFGCNTLNPAPLSSASAEVVRSLVREGHSPAAAERHLRSLTAAHAESSRDRMRQVFKDVPVLYGFASSAPLGPVAGATLERYFRSGGARDVGTGRVSRGLLGRFAPFSMAAAAGMTDRDPHIAARRDMCQFADDRRSVATKLSFVHQLMQRPAGEARLYLDRIQRLTTPLDASARQTPAVAQAVEEIARDAPARERFLDAARSAEQAPVRVRLIDVARDLGWLSEDERWQELALMLGELQARATVGVPEVNLACDLNRTQDLDGAFNRRVQPGGPADDVPHAAMRACLGSAEGRARMLAALVSADAADVQIAQTYLRHRPITDPAELRGVAARIARMAPGVAQVRALESLGRHYVSDREVLDMLAQLFAQTPSAPVQGAIAGILMRADLRAMAGPQLVRTLRDKRHPALDATMVDALIERLQAL